MSPYRAVLLVFASMGVLYACDDDNNSTTPDTVDLNGSWNYTVDVTVANGVCEGEENSPASTYLVTIAAIDPNGDGTWDVTATGFLDDPAATITGTVTSVTQVGDQITLSGSYPEDGGTTTTTHRLTIQSATRMTGTEDWSWTGGGGTCPDGKANITVVKVP